MRADPASPSPSAAPRETPRIEEFSIPACAATGDPGCMDCIEGTCDGIGERPVYVTFNRCTGCGEDDVYGQLMHQPDCPLYVEQEIPL